MEPPIPPFDGRRPPPRVVTLETTRYCNLRCGMCWFYRTGSTLRGPHMEVGTFQRLAECIFPFVDRVQLSVSGEPLARPLDDILAMSAKFGVRLEVHTNGTRLDQRTLDALLPHLGVIVVSFDAATKETFERIREGAVFEAVRENTRRLCDRVRALPAEQRPRVQLQCTLMERNVRELPALVDLAAELGVHRLICHHLHPYQADEKLQSLAFHRPLAIHWIGRALERARERGLPMRVEGLGSLTVESAESPQAERVLCDQTRVVPGLLRQEVHQDLLPATPELPAGQARASARARDRLRVVESADAGTDERSILVCDHLWNRLSVGIAGEVRPCCVPGNPVLGSVADHDLDTVWNGPLYRALRRRLVRKDPAAFCRGCSYLQEVRGALVEHWLEGSEIPDADPQDELVPVLVGVARELGPARTAQEAPCLVWPGLEAASHYVLELSTDRFLTVAFQSSQHGPPLREPRYEIPPWAWRLAPTDRELQWRAIAELDGNFVEVAAGSLRRLDPSPARST